MKTKCLQNKKEKRKKIGINCQFFLFQFYYWERVWQLFRNTGFCYVVLFHLYVDTVSVYCSQLVYVLCICPECFLHLTAVKQTFFLIFFFSRHIAQRFDLSIHIYITVIISKSILELMNIYITSSHSLLQTEKLLCKRLCSDHIFKLASFHVWGDLHHFFFHFLSQKLQIFVKTECGMPVF